MTDSTRPKILILESNVSARERYRQLFEDRTWEVVCESIFQKALSRLKQEIDTPFHLFISNFELPEMKGDDILKHAKTISPLTCRMLTVPSDRPDMVIRAINRAEIHACIVTPATDREVVDKVWSCIEIFNRAMKQEQLRRVVTHQNKQMVIIARRLKQKARRSKEKISDRKKEKIRLNAVLANTNRQKKDPVTLDDRTRVHGIDITPEALDQEFKTLSQFTRTLFEGIAGRAGLDSGLTDYQKVIKTDVPQNPADPTHEEFVRQVLRTVFSSPPFKPAAGKPEQETPPRDETIEDLVAIRLSKDRVSAFIRLKKHATDPALLRLTGLLDILRQQNISYGIMDDKDIDNWIATARPGHDEFMIARGEAPVQPVNAQIDYKFSINYTNPGKILEDGRMDFRDRGNIPYVKKGELLAVKTPPQQGMNGMTVSGDMILVDEAQDPVMIAGAGTELLEDGLCVHADLEGQPHLDPLGEISVNPELPVKGDVDFETGNIEFKGNIDVKGTIKDGFSVKGVTLRAKEIEGGIIDLTGDLYVSDGITDANIVSVGNIYAKFINNSQVKAFGNVVVQKEIIDSRIMLTGCCRNPSGVIMSSIIAAKAGVDAGRIGTDTSNPAHLKVGVDDHLDSRIQDIDSQLAQSLEQHRMNRKKIEEIEEQDQALYGRITQKAQEQEHLQNRIDTLNTNLADYEKNKDLAVVEQAAGDLKKLFASLKKIEAELNTIFHTQDIHVKKIQGYKESIKLIETSNTTLVQKKKALREFADKTRMRPSVIVNKSITQNTVVMGPNTSVTLNLDLKRCLVEEKTFKEDGLYHFKMDICDL